MTTSTNTYPYRAMIETLLSYCDGAKNSHLTSALFYPHQPDRMYVVDFAENARNSGLRKRSRFLANVNSRSRSLYAIARPSVVCLSSVVCNVRAPYSGGSNFRQYFYGIRYLGHPLTSTETFTEIVPGKPLRRGS